MGHLLLPYNKPFYYITICIYIFIIIHVYLYAYGCYGYNYENVKCWVHVTVAFHRTAISSEDCSYLSTYFLSGIFWRLASAEKLLWLACWLFSWPNAEAAVWPWWKSCTNFPSVSFVTGNFPSASAEVREWLCWGFILHCSVYGELEKEMFEVTIKWMKFDIKPWQWTKFISHILISCQLGWLLRSFAVDSLQSEVDISQSHINI